MLQDQCAVYIDLCKSTEEQEDENHVFPCNINIIHNIIQYCNCYC